METRDNKSVVPARDATVEAYRAMGTLAELIADIKKENTEQKNTDCEVQFFMMEILNKSTGELSMHRVLF